MEPELTPLQNQYINFAISHLLKYKMSQTEYDLYLNEFINKVKKVNIQEKQKDQLLSLYNSFKTEIKKKGTSKTQGTSKIHDELELQKTLREEEERKKTQEERNVDTLIRNYYEKKASKGVTIEFFLKQTEKECIEKYKSLSKDQFNEKMK